MSGLPGSRLVYGDRVIWENPSGLGHAFIKLRKQIREDQIIERLDLVRQDSLIRAAICGGSGQYKRRP